MQEGTHLYNAAAPVALAIKKARLCLWRWTHGAIACVWQAALLRRRAGSGVRVLRTRKLLLTRRDGVAFNTTATAIQSARGAALRTATFALSSAERFIASVRHGWLRNTSQIAHESCFFVSVVNAELRHRIASGDQHPALGFRNSKCHRRDGSRTLGITTYRFARASSISE